MKKAASEYIKDLFLSSIDQNQRKMQTIFVHFTCALDTHQIEIILRYVRKQLLEDVITELGVKF